MKQNEPFSDKLGLKQPKLKCRCTFVFVIATFLPLHSQLEVGCGEKKAVFWENIEFNFPHSKYCCRPLALQPLENGQEGPLSPGALGYKSFSPKKKNAFFFPLKVNQR